MQELINTNPEVIQHLLQPDEHYPNNANLPLLVYKNAFLLPEVDGPGLIEKTFRKNEWTNSWRNGIYEEHHFHSNTHEVLGIYSGHCIVQFGGDHGITLELRKGDVVVVPAGVAHKKIAAEDLRCVGAYPNGRDYTIYYGQPGEKEKTQPEISRVPLPENDPVFGVDGPLKHYWSQVKEYAWMNS